MSLLFKIREDEFKQEFQKWTLIWEIFSDFLTEVAPSSLFFAPYPFWLCTHYCVIYNIQYSFANGMTVSTTLVSSVNFEEVGNLSTPLIAVPLTPQRVHDT